MPDKLKPIEIAHAWIDDRLASDTFKLGEHVLLTCDPDTLHLGNRTHLWAAKNRNVNAIIIPDRRTVTPPSAMHEIMLQLDKADQQRRELRKINDEYDWHDVECKIWKVAPVDRLLPELLTCDLATLAVHALPVLDRHSEHLIRRYARASANDVDPHWVRLISQYISLGLTSSHQGRRIVAIAKNRLRQ